MKRLILLALSMLIACNGEIPPEPPDPPLPPTCEVWSAPEGCDCSPEEPLAPLLGVCAPPRVDRHVPWEQVRGVTAFSLALRDTKGIVEFTNYIRGHGWTTLRVGAQTTHDWCRARVLTLEKELLDADIEWLLENDLYFYAASSGYLPCGPFHGTAEWRENLVRMLEVTARIPDTWVQLIPTFTYKSVDKGSQAANIKFFNDMFDRVNAVVAEGRYRHVFYELFNEVVHPLSNHIKDEDVREMFLHAREKTAIQMGTDYHGGRADDEWRGRYPYVWRDVSHYLAMHPPRNPEPSYEIMQGVQDKFNYGKPMLMDETVSWASDAAVAQWGLRGKRTIAMKGHGTEDERMLVVAKHLRDIYKVTGRNDKRWRPYFHSIWGIISDRPGKMPNFDTDIVRSGNHD